MQARTKKIAQMIKNGGAITFKISTAPLIRFAIIARNPITNNKPKIIHILYFLCFSFYYFLFLK